MRKYFNQSIQSYLCDAVRIFNLKIFKIDIYSEEILNHSASGVLVETEENLIMDTKTDNPFTPKRKK